MSVFSSLGIDLPSALMYAVNFGVLAFVLTRVLYKPMLEKIDERRETVAGTLEAAEQLRALLEKERKHHESELVTLRKETTIALNSALKQAEVRSAALVEEAQVEKVRLVTEAHSIIKEMKETMVNEIEDEILKKMERVVVSVLKETASPEAVAKSVKRAWGLL